MAAVTGGCHCGAVRFRAEATLDPVVRCNCSICTKRGLLFSFVPERAFTLESGDDSLAEYLFHRRAIRHLFCKTCGVEAFARGTMPGGEPMVALNVRCLDGTDPNALNLVDFDGASL